MALRSSSLNISSPATFMMEEHTQDVSGTTRSILCPFLILLNLNFTLLQVMCFGSPEPNVCNFRVSRDIFTHKSTLTASIQQTAG